MIPVFADTSFYLALLRDNDPAHALAMAELRLDRPIVTTEFIILELGGFLSRSVDLPDFVAVVQGIQKNPRVRIIPLDSHLMNRGIQRMARRSDKDWFLTDCISFIVMEDEGLASALTTDKHFEQAGFAAVLR